MNDIKRRNFPAPTGRYKVDILRGGDWSSQPSLRLGISVGNRNQEGTKLETLIDWAAARFDTVNILVADSLQRHNIMAESTLDETQALEISLQRGHDWIERNKKILTRIPASTLYRFDHFRTHEDFQPLNRLLHGLYERNLRFRTLIDSDIQAFWARRQARGEAQTRDAARFMEHSRDYIIEELAVMKIFHEQCPGIEVYPGKFIQAVTSPERRLIDDLPESLKTYAMIEVDFVRNKAYAQK